MRSTTAAVALAAALTAALFSVPAGSSAATVTDAPGGQTTTSGLLPAAATAFPTGVGGWTATSKAAPTWAASTGHAAAGSLRFTSNGSGTGAASPTFSVVPGARYVATAWFRAPTKGHRVGVGFRFFDGSGALLSASSAYGQPITDATAGWRLGNAVVGIAPAGAATGAVTAMGLDGGTHQDQVDDVTVTQTTGSAAPIAAPLHTSGPDLLDGNGRRVHLHGVQLAGFTHRPYSESDIEQQLGVVAGWGANFIRLPLVENWALAGDCVYDAGYMPSVDRLVAAATGRGMVVLLDLHAEAVSRCGPIGKQKMPDAEGARFWQVVAARYADNPLVAFDLFNEPHDVTDGVWRNGGPVTSGGVQYTAVGMQRLYDTVRATGATNVVVASGNRWANFYPSGAPLTGTTNLVWGVHAYTCPQQTPANGGKCSSGPGGITDPSRILGHFATIGQTAPVIVTEFGFPDPANGYYIANTDAYVRGHSWVGWSVFVIDGGSTSPFSLIRDTAPTWNPQHSGMAAIRGMLGD